MNELKNQIETYVLPYFKKIKINLVHDEVMKTTIKIMNEELAKETEKDSQEIIELMDEETKQDSAECIYNYKNYPKRHN